jgi:hypothetical protein
MPREAPVTMATLLVFSVMFVPCREPACRHLAGFPPSTSSLDLSLDRRVGFAAT